MKRKTIVAATLAAAVLAGGVYAGSAQAQTGLCSRPNEHCISVTVTSAAGGAPQIRVDVPELYIHGPNHVIFWRLNNAGGQKYRFPAGGIAFKTEGGRAEFRCAAQGSSGTIYRCTDPNRTQGKFEYAIKVSGSPAVPVLDPWVINQ